VGAYAEALRFATQAEPVVVGKPSADFFQAALDLMKARPEETIMIGDDIESDVNAAQQIGVKGCLVRSGKYRAERDEPHETVRPFAIVDNLKQLVDRLFEDASLK
jgi:phospholysine phosphohistidine inorganic pyrophosphate phosphatase